ncbi:hypothetical protein IMAU30132_01638 [Lactobacillus helveticus]|nr:hypothetical protein [Lactobacillus helveticus]NRO39466.1 hypothetical protein [Lactobacillus helveticus]NRO49267.1 hypothetical protein [Lactobacillus helveticus]NRO59172.1 hypothetical protein [Lactobacillus helveticus]
MFLNESGIRRTHLRGKKKVETDIGIMFMAMNLKKHGAKKKVKPSNFDFKTKKHRNSLNNEFLCFYIWTKNLVFSQTLPFSIIYFLVAFYQHHLTESRNHIRT